MFSKDESKRLRLEFWDRFNKFSAGKRLKSRRPAKWIINDTGIRQMKLKFHFDEELASVGIDIETRNQVKRTELYQKLLSLKSKLESALGNDLVWEQDHFLPSGKSISRVHVVLRDVNIYHKDDWDKVTHFFYDRMVPLEDLYLEFKDFFKYSKSPA
jgi:hypothetical protein